MTDLQPVDQGVQRVAREDAYQQRNEKAARQIQGGDQRKSRQHAGRQMHARVVQCAGDDRRSFRVRDIFLVQNAGT